MLIFLDNETVPSPVLLGHGQFSLILQLNSSTNFLLKKFILVLKCIILIEYIRSMSKEMKSSKK